MWHEVDNSRPTHKQINVHVKIRCHVTRNIQYIVDLRYNGIPQHTFSLSLLYGAVSNLNRTT